METDIEKDIYISDNILLSDSSYYKHIFKKTEKIVCVIFYVIGHTPISHQSPTIRSLETQAQKTLDCVLETLSYRTQNATEGLYKLVHEEVALGSALRVAHASGSVERDVLDMLSLEIDSVLRMLRQYLKEDRQHIPILDKEVSQSKEEVRQVRKEGEKDTSLTSPRRGNGSKTTADRLDRRETIKSILASKGHSTIKDISSEMSEYSEKTLQRELISMIQDGVVSKEGERRWSRYVLVADAQ